MEFVTDALVDLLGAFADDTNQVLGGTSFVTLSYTERKIAHFWTTECSWAGCGVPYKLNWCQTRTSAYFI
jgi:hypothetical protein